MKKTSLLLLSLALLGSCTSGQKGDFTVTVKNSLDVNRTDEMVEVPMADLMARIPLVNDEEMYVVSDAQGNELPTQITHDNKLLFPVTVKAHSNAVYTISIGTPEPATPAAFGRHYPERVDDIAWENDLTAYRCYGPALQASGERAFGYDIWVKNTPSLVVEERYANELNPETSEQIAQLRREKRFDEADQLYHSVSYHVDHGNGMDCYKVGPTLGGGAAALLDGDEIVYPYCWASYEIMENGPLRFMVRLTYNPFDYHGETLVETRVISLAKGSQLNCTTVSYSGLSKAAPLAAGIVVHPENPDAYTLAADKGFISYQDLTDNAHADNGEIYVGIVAPWAKDARYQPFAAPEATRRGASGHILAVGTIAPDAAVTYWWGSAWSKAGWQTTDEWNDYLRDFARKVNSPLKVSY